MINTSDFTDSLINGTVTIGNGGLASFSKTLRNDGALEGLEKFYVRLRTESIDGPIVSSSQLITVNDTSAIIPEIPLFEFSTFTFTSGNGSVDVGPTSFSTYSNYTNSIWYSSYFSLSSGIQSWTVPSTGSYRIEAKGASGGVFSGSGNSYPGRPGSGATIRGDFILTKGTVLNIVVGQQALSGGSGTGGGGGSFVYTGSVGGNGLLIVAGGGGGWGHGSSSYNTVLGGGGSASQVPVNGASSPSPSSAGYGTLGYGGFAISSASYNGSGGGGAGWFSNGSNSVGNSYGQGGSRFSGGSLLSGARGGFGGGGGGGGSGVGPGGVGGGSGGGGGSDYNGNSWGAGQGGGSYNTGTNQSNTAGVTGATSGLGNGYVIVTKL